MRMYLLLISLLTLLSCSQGAVDAARLGAQANESVIAADIDRASLILCGKAFSDANATKMALATLSEPIISARGGIPLPARLNSRPFDLVCCGEINIHSLHLEVLISGFWFLMTL